MKDRTDVDRERDRSVETRPTKTPEPMPAESTPASPQAMERSQPDPTQFVDRRETSFDMSPYMERFQEIQAQFIEEPHEAVRRAEALVGEAVDHVMVTWHEQIRRIQNEVGDDKDTERLRIAMKGYRHIIRSLDGHRAA